MDFNSPEYKRKATSRFQDRKVEIIDFRKGNNPRFQSNMIKAAPEPLEKKEEARVSFATVDMHSDDSMDFNAEEEGDVVESLKATQVRSSMFDDNLEMTAEGQDDLKNEVNRQSATSKLLAQKKDQ